MPTTEHERDFDKEYDYTPARTLGEWRLPAGLRRALPYYFRRRWVSFGEPIPLFEHLHNTFGRIAHYRFMGTTIVSSMTQTGSTSSSSPRPPASSASAPSAA